MNLVLLRQRAHRVVLARGDRRAQHIIKVLRRRPAIASDSAAARAGSTAPIAVGVVGGDIGSAVLRSISTDDGSITLDCTWPSTASHSSHNQSSLASGVNSSGSTSTPPPLLPLDVLVGLARPETCKKVLRELSTLGVRSMTFVLCTLSDRSYSSSKLWREGEWVGHLERGAEQAFRTTLPAVHHCSSLQRALLGLGGATPLAARSDPTPIISADLGRSVAVGLGDHRAGRRLDGGDSGCSSSSGADWLPRTRLLCHDSGDGAENSVFAPTPFSLRKPIIRVARRLGAYIRNSHENRRSAPQEIRRPSLPHVSGYEISR
jgi:hypothetical protein